MSLGDVTRNSFAADVTFPAGKGSAGVMAGYLSNSCQGGCTGYFIAGAHVEAPVASTVSSDSGVFALGVQGTLGFAKPEGGTAWALSADLPLSYSARAGSARIIPYIAPGVGFGLVTGGGDSQSGVRFMLGGGLGVRVAQALTVSAGVKQVFISGGKAVFGAGLSWSGAHRQAAQ